ncbi:MAG TPA: Ppx/GppA phosphatase family protein [Bryobacteraceae bacterium]|nr:Ppx/GppA phosphatase family protein [Bryobacteraceae bacterium]
MPRYGAIDIGSNSLRMQVAEVLPGSAPTILTADREVTRIGEGVFRAGVIPEKTIDFVCSVLTRMAATYQKLEIVAIRAVATSAVRDASNQSEFVERASEAAGTPVEIISGPEEARLIHLGVQSRWPQPKQRVLIVDVGGGSAEIISAEHGVMVEGVSRPLGAVRLTEVFLKTDPPTSKDIHRLEQFIDEKMEPALKRMGGQHVDRAIATSATAAAIVCAVNRIPRPRREEADRLRATLTQVKGFYRELCHKDLNARRKIAGVGPRRAEIITAGTAVFLRVLERFRLASLYYSAAGVRDGIIADLASRGLGEVSRLNRGQLRVVEAMSRKYGVQVKHGRKVAAIGHTLFENLHPVHKLAPDSGRLLEAAAYLHDTGHFVSDTGHHKHSSYLVLNSDMPGFTDLERRLVGLLCRYHRKSMPSPRHEQFQSLSADDKRTLQMLAPLLRIADGLDSGREQKVEEVECQLNNGAVSLVVRGEGDLDLETWAAERAGDVFRQVYNLPLTLVRAKR